MFSVRSCAKLRLIITDDVCADQVCDNMRHPDGPVQIVANQRRARPQAASAEGILTAFCVPTCVVQRILCKQVLSAARTPWLETGDAFTQRQIVLGLGMSRQKS